MAIYLALLLSGWPTSARESYTAKQTQSEPSQKPLAPSGAGRLSRPPIRSVLPRNVYVCADGTQVVALIEPDAVRLTVAEHVYTLRRAETAGDGAKFAANGLVWSGAAEGWTLEDDTDSANPKILAEACTLESTFPTAPQLGTINGKATFGNKPPILPDDAALLLRLRTPKPPRGASIVVAELRILLRDRSSPVQFVLQFDAARAGGKTPLLLSGSISAGGRLFFRSAKPVAVSDTITPQTVDLPLALIPH